MAVAVAALALGACQEAQFHVEGTMAQATDSLLYLENIGLEGPVTVDSVRLDASGKFQFSGEAPQAPEFYRLRISDQIINLSIDSTETVTVEAAFPTMATRYEVKGSDNCSKIKELALRQIDLQQRALAIQRNPTMGIDATRDSIAAIVEAYKDDVKRNYIFKEPMKAYAYFALFQALGNQLIFNPHGSKEDNQGVRRRGHQLGHLLSACGTRQEPAQHCHRGHEDHPHHAGTAEHTDGSQHGEHDERARH